MYWLACQKRRRGESDSSDPEVCFIVGHESYEALHLFFCVKYIYFKCTIAVAQLPLHFSSWAALGETSKQGKLIVFIELNPND